MTLQHCTFGVFLSLLHHMLSVQSVDEMLFYSIEVGFIVVLVVHHVVRYAVCAHTEPVGCNGGR